MTTEESGIHRTAPELEAMVDGKMTTPELPLPDDCAIYFKVDGGEVIAWLEGGRLQLAAALPGSIVVGLGGESDLEVSVR